MLAYQNGTGDVGQQTWFYRSGRVTGILGGNGGASTSSYPAKSFGVVDSRISMPHVIVPGGPGVGKTTLLAELAARGYNKPSKSRLGPSLQNALRAVRVADPMLLLSLRRSCVETLKSTSISRALPSGSSLIAS
jgi:hypothetical protein